MWTKQGMFKSAAVVGHEDCDGAARRCERRCDLCDGRMERALGMPVPSVIRVGTLQGRKVRGGWKARMRVMHMRGVVETSIRIIVRMHMGMVTVRVGVEEDAGRWRASGYKEDNQRGQCDAT